MDKKSVSASILIVWLALIFSCIGICFSMFKYKNEKIEIKSINLISDKEINFFLDKKLNRGTKTLPLSKMVLGLKPATGKLDAESKIPSTITDSKSSEGYYATIYINSSVDFLIKINNIKIKTEKNEIQANEQRENIFIAIKDRKDSTKSLEKDEIDIVEFRNVSEPLKLTFLIWLDSASSDALEGANITFDLVFKKLV